MQLRPRQVKFVDRCHAALESKGNTIGVATVGFGKTIALSALASKYKTGVILQHRIELLEQNRDKFQRVAPHMRTSTFAANHKRWSEDGHTFAMMQSLVGNLDQMKPVDIVVIDESHHAESNSYKKIITECKNLNPDVKILGVTATPERGDGKGLRAIFSNVADIVTLQEMIDSRFLVKPRTYIIDMGVKDKLGDLKKGSSDFNMDSAQKLMDVEPVTTEVLKNWMNLAQDRRTIGFATTVAHSIKMMEAFRQAGVAAEHVDGTTPSRERRAIWKRLRTGETRVVWNCAVATEGFDEPGIGCVILNRPSMHRSTMIQMIGRGLRTISEPENYPGLVKDDCIILDFGASLLTHGSLEANTSIDENVFAEGEAPTKECPECLSEIPSGCKTCPICEHEFKDGPKDQKEQFGNFEMTEVDLLRLSPYRWEEIYNDQVIVAEAMTASAILVNFKGTWMAYGFRLKDDRKVMKLITVSHERLMALSMADDFLREYGDSTAAKKSKRWLNEPLSDKQASFLGIQPSGFFTPKMNRYEACCRITWKFNEEKIKRSILAINS
jgi:DNA repair protein RadD